MSQELLADKIKSYIPEDAVATIVHWIIEFKIDLTITPERKSVFGDYHWPQKGKGHRISVNGDLNPYAFLITLVHEVAHLTTWNKFRNKVSSHGNEWKSEYKILMEAFSGKRIFPLEVRNAFLQHLIAPSHTHCNDPHLMMTLNKYNAKPGIYLGDLAEGTLFRFRNHIYKKGEKLRKRYQCEQLKTNRHFLFNPTVEIILV